MTDPFPSLATLIHLLKTRFFGKNLPPYLAQIKAYRSPTNGNFYNYLFLELSIKKIRDNLFKALKK